jgi:hypothetical protein
MGIRIGGIMIKELVDRFIQAKPEIARKFAKTHTNSYEDMFRIILNQITEEDENWPNPEEIETVDFGDYQGMLIMIVAGFGYQPQHHWATNVFYGSCSGCDTLQGIHEYSESKPTDEQVEDYMTLALHLVQKMVKIS